MKNLLKPSKILVFILFISNTAIHISSANSVEIKNFPFFPECMFSHKPFYLSMHVLVEQKPTKIMNTMPKGEELIPNKYIYSIYCTAKDECRGVKLRVFPSSSSLYTNSLKELRVDFISDAIIRIKWGSDAEFSIDRKGKIVKYVESNLRTELIGTGNCE